MDTVDTLRQFAFDRGASAFGVADLDRLRRVAPEFEHETAPFRRAFVLGVRLQDAVLEELEDRPTPQYFHHYRQANWWLDRVAFELGLRVQALGGRALPIPASQVVAQDPMRGRLSHRLLGWDAGLGWIGRSTLLVHPEHGARLRYVSVLTDLDLPAGSPLDRDCGACRRCIEVCPAGAIDDDSRQFRLDACYATLDAFRRLPYIGQHICGLCVRACGGRDWPHGT